MENVPVGVEAEQKVSAEDVAYKIILLGPDCSGKSTIAAYLEEELGIKVQANRRINDDILAAAHVINFVSQRVMTAGESFILDQFMYPVDIVYNKTLRDEPSVMEILDPILAPRMKEAGVLIIHVDAEDAELRRRYALRGDELWDADQIVKVANAYRQYFAEVEERHNYAYLDTTGVPMKYMGRRAMEFINAFYLGDY